MLCRLSFDSDKTLTERGLDFAHAAEVFAGVNVTAEDARFDYGEPRFTTAGVLDGRLGLDAARRGSPHYQH